MTLWERIQLIALEHCCNIWTPSFLTTTLTALKWWNEDWNANTEITGKICPRITVSTTVPHRLLHYWTQLSYGERLLQYYAKHSPTSGSSSLTHIAIVKQQFTFWICVQHVLLSWKWKPLDFFVCLLAPGHAHFLPSSSQLCDLQKQSPPSGMHWFCLN